MFNFDVTEKDIRKAFVSTKYQRAKQTACPEPKCIRTIFEQTPIPETKYLHITEKFENEPPKPKENKSAKPKQPKNDQDIYAVLRQAQGISGPSQGPKRGVGQIQPDPFPFDPMPGPRPFPGPRPHPGLRPDLRPGHGNDGGRFRGGPGFDRRMWEYDGYGDEEDSSEEEEH